MTTKFFNGVEVLGTAIMPAPTADGHAATKYYTDSSVGSAVAALGAIDASIRTAMFGEGATTYSYVAPQSLAGTVSIANALDVLAGRVVNATADALADANSYTDQKITDLIGMEMPSLDTLKEIVDFLGADENTVLTDSIIERITKVSTDLAAEVTRAELAEGGLDARLDILEGANTQVGSVAYAVKEEADRAQLAEADLLSAINTEANTREQADSDLQGAIDAEAAFRLDGDTLLDGRLDKIETNLRTEIAYVYENNTGVFADAVAGVQDLALRDGWYFKNQSTGQKVNWYFFDGQAENVTLGDFSSYFVATFDSLVSLPFLAVYTTPTGTGDAASWYKSRKVMVPTGTPVSGKKYLVYFGTEPEVHPELPRLQMVPATESMRGTLDASERVLTASLGSDSGSAANNVEFVAESVGVFSPLVKRKVEFRIRPSSAKALSDEITARTNADTTLQNNITSEAAARAAADTALQSNIDSEASTRLAADNALQEALDAEETARIAGDAATLASANSYTDTAVANLVDSAPALLDTLNELAAAIGDDPNFAASIASQVGTVQGNLDAEITRATATEAGLQDAIDAEVARAELAEGALDGRLDLLEGDVNVVGSVANLIAAADDVKFHTNLASFPIPGQEEVIYVAESDNRIYRYKETVIPAVYDHTVGATGTFATLQDALADVSVQDGDTIFVQAGTYSVSSTITISKQVKIYGAGPTSTVFATAGTSGDPVSMFSVTTDNVVLMNLGFQHKKTSNTSVETAVTVSGPGFPQTRVSNFVMDTCRIEHVEFGLTIRGSDWKIANTAFVYKGSNNSTRRHVGVYGTLGNCFAVNNTSNEDVAVGVTGNTRWWALTSTTGSNPNETYEGTLVIQGNSQVGGTLQQFYSQDSWQGTAGGFNLIVKDNTSNETSAFVSFYGAAADFGNILGEVTVQGNSISNLHGGTPAGGKGLIGIDGAGGVAFRSSALTVHHSDNTLGNLTFRADYVEVTGSTGSLVGRSSANIGSASVSLDSEIPSIPSAPSTPAASGGLQQEYVELSPEPDLSGLEADIAAEETRALAVELAITERINDLVAGAGMTRTGDTFDVVGTSGRLSVAADSIDVDTTLIPNLVEGDAGKRVRVNAAGNGFEYKAPADVLVTDSVQGELAAAEYVRLKAIMPVVFTGAIADNQAATEVDATMSFPAASADAAMFDVLLKRNGKVMIGRIRITVGDGGSSIDISTEGLDPGPVGITFTAALVGSDVVLKAASTSTGFPAAVKMHRVLMKI